MKKVGIVSCDKWIGKINEDLCLNQKLISSGIDSALISWENPNINFNDFDLLIIKSIWGYQHKLTQFYEWLDLIDKSKIKIFNDTNIIRNNIRKDLQFKILTNNNIPLIETEFIYSNMIETTISEKILEVAKTKLNNPKLFVVKPIVSGSGNNTVIIDLSNNNSRPNTVNINETNNIYSNIIENPNNGLIIQPFIDTIDDGELSSIYIGGCNTHNMLRFPAIFHEKRKPELQSKILKEFKQLGYKVSTIPDFQNYLYMRVDMILFNGDPKVLEVELTDPDLLTKYVDDVEKDEILNTLTKQLIKRL